MPITTKVNGAYVAPVAVFTKKAGVYAAAQAMGKVAGAYQSVVGPAGQIPVILLAPVINGTPQVNTPLSITAGQTSGATSTVRSIYSGGALVAGPAAGVGYTPINADAGKSFSVIEVASNVTGPATNPSVNSAACLSLPYVFVVDNTVGQSTERITPNDPDASYRIVKNSSPFPITIFPSANLNYQNNRPTTGGVICPAGSESLLNDGGSYYATTRKVSVTALTYASGVATATAASHGFNVGDSITVVGALDGAASSPYNSVEAIVPTVLSVPDANTFTYVPGGTPTATAPTTMPTAGPFSAITIERFFP